MIYSGVLRLATLEMFKWLPKEAFIFKRTTTRFIMFSLINNSFLNVWLYNVVSMVTVTRGEIIELNVRIETRMVTISFFACFCSSCNSRITVFNHYMIRILKRLERLQVNIETAKN